MNIALCGAIISRVCALTNEYIHSHTLSKVSSQRLNTYILSILCNTTW